MLRQHHDGAFLSCIESVCPAFVFRLRAIPTRLRGVAALHVRCRSVPAGPAAPHSRQRMQAACGGARLGRGSSHLLLTSCAGKKPIIRRAGAALRWCWPCHAAGILPCRGTDTLRSFMTWRPERRPGANWSLRTVRWALARPAVTWAAPITLCQSPLHQIAILVDIKVDN